MTQDTLDPSAGQNPLALIGQQLKEARQQKNLSLNYVAEVTRINISILRDLEEGHLQHNPGPVFIRGFIRTYARLVGLETPALHEALRGLAGTQDTPSVGGIKLSRPDDRSSSGNGKGGLKWAIGAVLIVLLLGGAYWLLSPFSDKLTLPNDTPTTAATSENTIVTPETTAAPTTTLPPEAPKAPEAPKPESSSALPPPPGSETMTTVGTSPATTAHVETPGTADVALESIEDEAGTLVLQAKGLQATWIGLQIDEQTPLDILVHPGEQVEWKARTRYQITVGNTKGVELLLNGKPLVINQQKDLLTNWIVDNTMVSR